MANFMATKVIENAKVVGIWRRVYGKITMSAVRGWATTGLRRVRGFMPCVYASGVAGGTVGLQTQLESATGALDISCGVNATTFYYIAEGY